MNGLAYAVLGLLFTRPRTSYEVSQRMRAPIGWMWSAQHSQLAAERERIEVLDRERLSSRRTTSCRGTTSRTSRTRALGRHVGADGATSVASSCDLYEFDGPVVVGITSCTVELLDARVPVV